MSFQVLTHSALERMGSVTTILCQKTGTLTSDQASGLFYMLLQNLVLLTIIGFIKVTFPALSFANFEFV